MDTTIDPSLAILLPAVAAALYALYRHAAQHYGLLVAEYEAKLYVQRKREARARRLAERATQRLPAGPAGPG